MSAALRCLQRQVVKLPGRLFYFWTLLRNNSMATNLHVFTRVARLAVLRPNFRNLDVFQVGWPHDFGLAICFFGLFLKVVWPKFFSVGRFGNTSIF